jgi:DNA-binding NtrC family response regulator
MNKSVAVLVVDDSRDMLELIRRQLQDININPFISDNVIDAIDILETTPIDLLISDINMPNVGGEQLIRYSSEHYPSLPILVISGYPNLQVAVNVMKMGALEYLVKPFTAEELEQSINSILQIGSSAQNLELIQNETKLNSFEGIIGSSSSMQELYRTINRTKSNKATVLISGNSGTGKELVARAIHYNSDFSSAPFVPVNCGAIPQHLIESELFGHLKGSFTGAISNRVGFFQAADGGTIFLDEIGNTSLDVQAKLLRVLQEKEVTAVGGTKSQKIDVRIISASNVNLLDLVRQNKFREDLYYRLNVISIDIPALKDREGDILSLVLFFNKKYSKELGKKPLKFEKGVLSTFENYSWPGNVRELENLVHRLVVMNDEKVSMLDIPDYLKTKINTNDDSFVSLKQMELNYIKKTLAYCNNNKTHAAKLLGIDRKTLREKLK